MGIDAGPEISKRLINNAKEQLITKAQSPEYKELVSLLLELDDQTLITLLNWLYSDIEATERAEVSKWLCRLSFDELVRLAQLTPENRKRLLDLFKKPLSERFPEKVHRKLKEFDEKWGRGLDQWEKWLEEKKKGKGKE
ncbi:MAG: hypothetical protein ACUVUQ_10590 [Thermodesulfovibrionales bacterium]